MLYDNILPDIKEVFKLHGLIDGKDFVIDKKPPDDFVRPYKELEDYGHSLSLFNGFCVQFLAVAREAKKWRGRSFDGGIIDEALLFTETIADRILLPTLRGLNRWRTKDDTGKEVPNPYWRMLSIYSSHPDTPAGEWFLKYEKLADKHPSRYGWVEATAEDNKAVVGEDYVDRQREVMNYEDFQREIMNRGDVQINSTSYYHQLSQAQHAYETPERSDDVYTSLPLTLSLDFGGRFSCLTVGQTRDAAEYIVDEFDTNNITEAERQMGRTKKLGDIVQDFIEAYRHHGNRKISIYGDQNGLNKQVTDDRNLFEQVMDQLVVAGWDPQLMVEYGHNPLHKTRYLFMNTCLEERTEGYPAIRINRRRCPNTWISLQRCKVTDDFKKNKRVERLDTYNQSHAPHLSDTIDYRVFNRYFYMIDDIGGAGITDSGIESI